MLSARTGVMLLAAATAAAGCAISKAEPSEVQNASVPGSTLEQRQQQTGAAYRSLQQARYEKKLAEQDLLNAQAAYDAAQKNADALKREADTARKAYAEAQAREKAAEAAYERGMKSVDEIYRDPARGTSAR